MIVSYISYNMPFEEEVPLEMTLGELHEKLYDICHTYIITDIRIK